MNNLKDHIDEPMLGIVAGLNLLGFQTMMSCCGFSYKNEKVRKSHLGKTYVYIKHENVPCVFLSKLSIKSGWVFQDRGLFIDWYGLGWQDWRQHEWTKKESVHNYEAFLMDISKMEQALYLYRNYMKDSVTIHDGNESYKENVSKYWQYEPAEPWVVTKEEFINLITLPKSLEGQIAT
jgi:hypothetical protein